MVFVLAPIIAIGANIASLFGMLAVGEELDQREERRAESERKEEKERGEYKSNPANIEKWKLGCMVEYFASPRQREFTSKFILDTVTIKINTISELVNESFPQLFRILYDRSMEHNTQYNLHIFEIPAHTMIDEYGGEVIVPPKTIYFPTNEIYIDLIIPLTVNQETGDKIIDANGVGDARHQSLRAVRCDSGTDGVCFNKMGRWKWLTRRLQGACHDVVLYPNSNEWSQVLPVKIWFADGVDTINFKINKEWVHYLNNSRLCKKIIRNTCEHLVKDTTYSWNNLTTDESLSLGGGLYLEQQQPEITILTHESRQLRLMLEQVVTEHYTNFATKTQAMYHAYKARKEYSMLKKYTFGATKIQSFIRKRQTHLHHMKTLSLSYIRPFIINWILLLCIFMYLLYNPFNYLLYKTSYPWAIGFVHYLVTCHILGHVLRSKCILPSAVIPGVELAKMNVLNDSLWIFDIIVMVSFLAIAFSMPSAQAHFAQIVAGVILITVGISRMYHVSIRVKTVSENPPE